MSDPATRYQLLRLLDDDPTLSQRDLAREMGLSLGKTNYCLRALIDKGYIKAVNFKNSRKRLAYLYKLTPAGLAAKTRAAARFLIKKQREYDRLQIEIAELKAELDQAQ